MNNSAAQRLATSAPGLPRTLADFRDFHQGATILVCGCGASLNELSCPEKFITIGVNDVSRRFDPTYLVVLNPRNQFSGDRFRYVEQSRAQAVFTQLDLGIPHPHVVRFPLGSYGGADFSNPEILHYTSNSPYLAVCLAVHLGARRIGLIGVDFTDHHFFAPTGKHALTARLNQINREYAALGRACRERGIEIVNLSRQSLLTAFPKGGIEDLVKPLDFQSSETRESEKNRRVFFVNYRFLSCGEVFTEGLRNATRELGIQAQDAYWDDPQLPAQVRAFDPDLLFVVHGRRFVQRWGGAFRSYNSAVWLVDEPYEVDDTANWSSQFNTVYVNDPSTLDRHRNAHYLPVAYDPWVHKEAPGAKQYAVGFIGGYNPTREMVLLELLDAGLLSYVVGGPWKNNRLRQLCLADNIPAAQTAALYQQTRLVINVFRDLHHFNRQKISGWSLNPRVYEALACGALVVSEQRPELAEVLPDLPVFSDVAQLLDTVRDLLADEEHYRAIQRTCTRRLAEHTYRARLLQILETCAATPMVKPVHLSCEAQTMSAPTAAFLERADPLSLDSWTDYGGIARRTAEGGIVLDKLQDDRPGTEQGLVSTTAYRNIELSFELKLTPAAWFIAKVHQQDQFNQCTNSYHLVCHPQYTYLAMHNRVLRHIRLKRGTWQQIGLRRYGDRVEIEVAGTLVARVHNSRLQQGYCFLGVKGGVAALRNIALRVLPDARPDMVRKDVLAEAPLVPEYTLLYSSEGTDPPTVSIITTVYDRVQCLRECLQSVKQLGYRDFEQIIVSDHPPAEVVADILHLLKTEATGAVSYANLQQRFNNWGIAPASVGVHLARGHYLCFLSDDNGYTPDHLNPLVAALEQDQTLGFVYSSCRYAGRLMLRNSTPHPGRIDLGQPLFRKELFERYLPGALPFDMMAWDWHMIDAFMQHGVKWRHIDRPSFLFRLADCKRIGRA